MAHLLLRAVSREHYVILELPMSNVRLMQRSGHCRISYVMPWILAALLYVVGCGATAPGTSGKATSLNPHASAGVDTKKSAVCAILAINDTYHIEAIAGDRGGMARVRALRATLEQTYPDLLVTHAGDFVLPSFLGRMYKGAHMIEAMNRLDGGDGFDNRLFATFGNHEFELNSVADFSARIGESKFRFVSSNVHFRQTVNGQPGVLAPADTVLTHVVVRCGSMKVGLFGITIDSTKPAYIEAIDEPVEVARRETAALRKEGADAVVAITHLAMTKDKFILEKLGDVGPDIILGGHEHERQQQIVGKRGVYKADSDAASANIVRIEKTATGIDINVESRVLEGALVPQDPALQTWVNAKLAEHEALFCAERLKSSADPQCLQEVLATAGVDLIAEELSIRKYETNLGNWIADVMLGAFPKEAIRPQIAFINSGALRLNANLAGGTKITRRTVEELFAFPVNLTIIKIDGATLQKVVDHSVSNWTGEGRFLQISGFSFVHDTKNGKALQLRFSGPNARDIQPNEIIYAVTYVYLVDAARDQDGYTMLNPKQIVASEEFALKDAVFDGLLRLSKENKPLAPKVEGRICVAPCASR